MVYLLYKGCYNIYIIEKTNLPDFKKFQENVFMSASFQGQRYAAFLGALYLSKSTWDPYFNIYFEFRGPQGLLKFSIQRYCRHETVSLNPSLDLLLFHLLFIFHFWGSQQVLECYVLALPLLHSLKILSVNNLIWSPPTLTNKI